VKKAIILQRNRKLKHNWRPHFVDSMNPAELQLNASVLLDDDEEDDLSIADILPDKSPNPEQQLIFDQEEEGLTYIPDEGLINSCPLQSFERTVLLAKSAGYDLQWIAKTSGVNYSKVSSVYASASSKLERWKCRG
jgi:hypothetical protein